MTWGSFLSLRCCGHRLSIEGDEVFVETPEIGFVGARVLGFGGLGVELVELLLDLL